MCRLTILPALFLTLFVGVQTADAHCQVPCGIYGDEARFEALLEDATTIAKATDQINDLAGTHDAQGSNQLVRWITTKEAHASNIQKVMGDYFLAQRIKTDDPKYVEKLTAAHKVIVAAMKTKQTVDGDNATALTKAIEAFAAVYTAKGTAQKLDWPVREQAPHNTIIDDAAQRKTVPVAEHNHDKHSHDQHHSHGDIIDHVLPSSGFQR